MPEMLLALELFYFTGVALQLLPVVPKTVNQLRTVIQGLNTDVHDRLN